MPNRILLFQKCVSEPLPLLGLHPTDRKDRADLHFQSHVKSAHKGIVPSYAIIDCVITLSCSRGFPAGVHNASKCQHKGKKRSEDKKRKIMLPEVAYSVTTVLYIAVLWAFTT